MREGCQQAADLGGGHGDEVAYVVAAMAIMPQACPGKVVHSRWYPLELRRPEGRQARAWTVWRAGTSILPMLSEIALDGIVASESRG